MAVSKFEEAIKKLFDKFDESTFEGYHGDNYVGVCMGDYTIAQLEDDVLAEFAKHKQKLEHFLRLLEDWREKNKHDLWCNECLKSFIENFKKLCLLEEEKQK